MPSLSHTALAALLAATNTVAQVTFADVWIYGSEKCADDAFGVSASLAIWEDSLVTAGENGGFQGSCGFAYIDVDDSWPQNSQGNYDVHIDSSSVPAGCQVIFYSGAPIDDAVSQGDCWAFNQLVPSGTNCPSVTLPGKFGYSMCCGADNCKVASSVPSTKPSGAKREAAAVKAPAVRDVTAIKRSAPLDSQRLDRRDCTFSGSGSALTTYGPQVRVSAELSCPGTQTCQQGVDITYESSISNSFGVSTSAGGSLFEVISVSVEFSYEYSESQSTSHSWTQTVNVPGDSKGYLTFRPKIECSPKGTFSGGCDWDEGVEGEGCFPVFIGDLPDGQYIFVASS